MIDEEINRLHFENIVWVIFAILAFLNIVGDNDSINFLKTNNPKYKNESDTIFKITLFCTFLIYLYFFNRNIKSSRRYCNFISFAIKINTKSKLSKYT